MPCPLKFVSLFLAALLSLAACSSPPVDPAESAPGPVKASLSASAMPRLVRRTAALPRPQARNKTETYSVIVNRVKAHDLLFAIARDANLNIDIHPGVSGNVTLKATDQTLPQLLARISRQLGLRFELDGPNLVVMPDAPFLRTYRLDYVNMERAGSSVAATALLDAGGVSDSPAALRLESRSRHAFWTTIARNVREIASQTERDVSENDALAADHAPTPANAVSSVRAREAAAVTAHPESGVLAVRATLRQHEKIQEFLSQVMQGARRQVLIDAMIVEVRLFGARPQGIDWNRAAFGRAGRHVMSANALFELPSDTQSGGFHAAIRFLEEFGEVKVLSSPKLSVMNNQTAVVRVVDDVVYFTLKANTTLHAAAATTTFTASPQTVPVGFVMNVTPQISENNSVILNIRPSISSIVSYVADPNPTLANPCGAGVANCAVPPIASKVPVVRTREIESVVRVNDGNIAVIGGLIEDAARNGDFSPMADGTHDGRAMKTEWVILLRPTVVREGGMNDADGHSSNVLSERVFRTGERNLPGGAP